MKKYYFNRQQMEAAQVLAEELQAEAVTGHTTRQNMVDALNSRYTDVDAESIVQELCSGIDTFHKLYNKTQHQDVDTVIREEMDVILSKLSDEKKRELLAGMMQTFAEWSGEELPELENLELDMMQDTVCAYISEYGCTGMNFDALPELNVEDAQALEDALSNREAEEYAALAMYILGRDGNLDQMPSDLSPSAIGITTAASAAVQRSVIGMMLGKIDMEQVKRVLKIVGGLLLIALTAVIAVSGVATAGIISVLGIELLAEVLAYAQLSVIVYPLLMIASSVAMGGSVVYVAGRTIGEISSRFSIAQEAGALLNKLNEYVRDTVVPAAKAFWQMIRSKINELRYGKEETETAEETEVETAEEAEFAEDEIAELSEELEESEEAEVPEEEDEENEEEDEALEHS